MAQLSDPLLILAQVMISWFVGSSPTWGSVLTAWSLFGILLSKNLKKNSPSLDTVQGPCWLRPTLGLVPGALGGLPSPVMAT